MQFRIVMASALVGTALFSSCGSNSIQIVKGLDFKTTQQGDHLIADVSMKIQTAPVILPEISFNLPDPKRPDVSLGVLEVSSTQIKIKLDVTETTKLPVESGVSLPNGIALPIVLPADVVPLAIAIPGTKAKVYLAISKQKILAGVALTLGSLGGSAGDVLKLPMNIFFPFQISPGLSGNAGFFTGDQQGLAVFALKDLPVAPSTLSRMASLKASNSLLAERSFTEAEIQKPEVWKMKRSKVSSMRMYRLYEAMSDIREVEIK